MCKWKTASMGLIGEIYSVWTDNSIYYLSYYVLCRCNSAERAPCRVSGGHSTHCTQDTVP